MSHVFIPAPPDEEREGLPPLRTPPPMTARRARGAQFGHVKRLGAAHYYGPLDAPKQFRPFDARSFRRWRLGWQHRAGQRKATGAAILVENVVCSGNLIRTAGHAFIQRT